MSEFIGRSRELGALRDELDRARRDRGHAGRCLLVRGRRRVGKSRLVEQFCAAAGVPYVYFTASRQGAREPALFAEEVLQSDLPGRDVFAETNPGSWDAALRLLTGALGDDPAIVVIDEFPYLIADDGSIEATFQKQWDRLLARRRVLLVLVGSDLAMMEALNTHGRPFFQRGAELLVPPLSPAETADVVGSRSAASAFDAYLLTGGLPLLAGDWPRRSTMWTFLERALLQPNSPLIVSAERTLAAEFPADVQARAVLAQIGAGEVTFTHIARAAGGMAATSLQRSLEILTAKRLVVREVPLSTRPSKEARYRIADPYLRFWLRFVGPHLAEIERGRGDRVLERVRRDWAVWRGRAIEPVVREAVSRLLPIDGLPPAAAVGGYWTRTNVPEIDLVAADRSPVAAELAFAGTIKWYDDRPLGSRDVARLAQDIAALPGARPDLPLLAVGRAGVDATGVVALGPDELLAAWP